MLAKDLKQKTNEELQSLAQELEAKLRGTRFSLVTRQLKNVSEVGAMKRDLARVKTVLRQSKPQA